MLLGQCVGSQFVWTGSGVKTGHREITRNTYTPTYRWKVNYPRRRWNARLYHIP
jgi:hypothetical protein